ncbi:MAG TPA: RidA family protein [Polyangia bacterium]|jgi:enamine deaminase RidA (YjgF/YER057c/UK114 family)|nr:RidA family protein [Polyangia bacterium]
MPDVVQPEGWAFPKGYANGMVAIAGRIVAIAGQMGVDRDGQLVSKDFLKQFEQALDNVVTVVRVAGGSAEDIISMTVYVLDRLQYLASTQELGVAWRLRAGHHFPAMTLVEVRGLVDAQALVEIQALAVLPTAVPATTAPAPASPSRTVTPAPVSR